MTPREFRTASIVYVSCVAPLVLVLRVTQINSSCTALARTLGLGYQRARIVY